MTIVADVDLLLLGVDGGGSGCRARLCAASGKALGEGSAGPANIRFGVSESFASVYEATRQCLQQAGFEARDLGRIVACLALAGATEPGYRAEAQWREDPFRQMIIVPDAQAACIGAHAGEDGGVIILGTGSVGWAKREGHHHRVGGWGWPISDEGSGAWLGCEALRRTLWAYDGRIAWSGLLRSLFERFDSDAHAIVRWTTTAAPGDFAAIAPAVVEYSRLGDPLAAELMRQAAGHADALAARLIALGAPRLSLMGGLASSIEAWLSEETRKRLAPPRGDALDGALRLAKESLHIAAETKHS